MHVKTPATVVDVEGDIDGSTYGDGRPIPVTVHVRIEWNGGSAIVQWGVESAPRVGDAVAVTITSEA